MKYSLSRLATMAEKGVYQNTGKIDRDTGFRAKRSSNTKNRLIRANKAKQKRLLDKLSNDE